MRDELFNANDEANKDFSICVNVTTEEKQEFYDVCARQGMTPSKVIRQMMKECIKHYKHTNIL